MQTKIVHNTKSSVYQHYSLDRVRLAVSRILFHRLHFDRHGTYLRLIRVFFF